MNVGCSDLSVTQFVHSDFDGGAATSSDGKGFLEVSEACRVGDRHLVREVTAVSKHVPPWAKPIKKQLRFQEVSSRDNFHTNESVLFS